jgi:DNA-binding CsgD family transcriptional regulator
MRKLAHASADLYKATSQHAFGNQVHTLIRSVCSVEHATYANINMRNYSSAAIYSHPDIERLGNVLLPTYLYYANTYPEVWSQILNPKHQGKLLRIKDVVSRSFAESIGFIKEYAKPTLSEYQLCYHFRTPGHFAAITTCNRNGREFSDKEKAIVEFLTPHLQSAYENCLAFEAMSGREARSAAMQQVIPVEMIWLDQDLAVLEISPRIPQLIKEFFDHQMRFKQMPRKLVDWLRAAKASEPLRPLIIRRADASLKIRFYPERLPGSHLLTFHRQRTTPMLEDLKPLGLSRRESEVLLWLAQGKTNAEISRILYINRRTADWHVQSILSKLGVENRTSATLLVADLLQG